MLTDNKNVPVQVEGTGEAMVSITEEEYDRLVYDSRVLRALYAGGVDNWEGYGDSLESMEEY